MSDSIEEVEKKPSRMKRRRPLAPLPSRTTYMNSPEVNLQSVSNKRTNLGSLGAKPIKRLLEIRRNMDKKTVKRTKKEKKGKKRKAYHIIGSDSDEEGELSGDQTKQLEEGDPEQASDGEEKSDTAASSE